MVSGHIFRKGFSCLDKKVSSRYKNRPLCNPKPNNTTYPKNKTVSETSISPILRATVTFRVRAIFFIGNYPIVHFSIGAVS